MVYLHCTRHTAHRYVKLRGQDDIQKLEQSWLAYMKSETVSLCINDEYYRKVASCYTSYLILKHHINPLTPNDLYISRTTPLTSKCCILYIYSTNVGTEYFKHALDSPFFSLQNAVCFITLTSLVPVLFTFYIQGVLKLKKNIFPAPKS